MIDVIFLSSFSSVHISSKDIKTLTCMVFLLFCMFDVVFHSVQFKTSKTVYTLRFDSLFVY